MPNMSLLYKYEPINEYSLRNLKNAQIFFNAPISFNDPFDCSLDEAYLTYEEQDFVDMFNYHCKIGKIKSSKTAKSIADLPHKFIEESIAGFKGAISLIGQNQLRNMGCTCFTKRMDHILMWAHYANGHKGMCLEFDATMPPFDRAYQVNYSKTFPPVNPAKIILNTEAEVISRETVKPLLAKFECWAYEEEWRLFHKEPNKLYGYDVNALKAVYFGSSCMETDIEIVCLILQGQNKNIKFYRGNKSKTGYALEFQEFQYISHLKSKEKL